jgi:hypothetical protein
VAAAGLLVAGSSLDHVGPSVIDLAMTASPLVSMASAAQIDILRIDTLYRISPLAHLHVEYPAWYTAVGWHLTLALCCFLALVWKCRSARTAATR